MIPALLCYGKKKQGFSKQTKQKIQKGKSLSVIADELEETVDTIRPLYERVQAELVTQK